jgi:hypothetical protein
MPGREHPWKRGYLQGVDRNRDRFRIKWSLRGFGRDIEGIWRVHPSFLFDGTVRLPIPNRPASLAAAHALQTHKEDEVATVKKTTKKVARSKKATASDEGNGASRTRTDKLAGLSDAKKRNIAKLIYRERSKKPATSWGDIATMIEDKYDWTLPGSMTGRRLLRDHGPDNAEEAIIQQTRTEKSGTKKKKASPKKAKVVEEELEEEEEELDEEEMEEEYEEELEDEEDEDEEDEDEEEEAPAPRSRKKVAVTRGRGKKANPSKK